MMNTDHNVSPPPPTGWRWLVVGAAVALAAGCVKLDKSDLEKFVAETKASAPAAKLEPPPEMQPYRPFTYTAQGLKDPFLPSAFVQQELRTVAEIPPEELPDTGIRPDPDRVREELEKYALGSLKMVGTFRNPRDGTLWALVLAPDGIVHRVQKGNHLGLDHGRILNITDQRVELKEIVAEGRRWVEREASLTLTQ